jgi:glycosyltransferase involved in cell wall biosynthesis
VALEAAKAVAGSRRRRRDRPVPEKKLLTLEGDYSLATIRDLGLEQIITSRDLDGFFEHVWTVHPLVGAAPEDRNRTPPGPPTHTDVGSRHTMIEGKTERSGRLKNYPILNFVLAQQQLLAQLGRLIRRERVSVIRASDPFYLGLLGVLLTRLNGVPLVIHLIANYDGTAFMDSPAYPRLFRRRSVEKRIERFLLPRGDLVAAGNRDILEYALENGAAPDRSTVFLVGNLIDPAHFDWEPSERPSVRAELGLGDEPFVICVGRLEPLKHPEDIVRVIADVRLRQLGLRAVLIGEGTMREPLEAMADELGIEGRVLFPGRCVQEWVARALTAATVVLSPLTGRALIEATLSGTPVVAYDIDWQSELVHHEKTGLLVSYRDVDKMAEATFELVSQPTYAAALGAAGRERTRAVMDSEALLEHEKAAYRSLFAGAAPPAISADRQNP